MTGVTLAETLGRFVSEASFEDLPAAVVDKAKVHILDTFGAALAGATSEDARLSAAALLAPGGSGPAPVWGTAIMAHPREAAMLNGVAAHAFELDDTGGCDHSGAVVLPAAVAALSLIDRAVTGREFLTAVVLGYDLGRRVLEAFGGYRPHNEAGWNSTGTCGTFAATGACASLLRLDPSQSTSALGQAASFSGGLWAFIHDGAMTKRIHAGRAAEGGLTAALLARAGVTGPAHVFEDGWGGFFNAFAHAPIEIKALTQRLGEDWRIMRAAIKPYASCRDTHSAVDAVGTLLDRHAIAAQDVARIEARLSPFAAGMVGGRDVSTMPAAQMSLPYAIAARTVLGRADLSAYAADRRQDPALLAFMDQVAVESDLTVPSSDHASVAIITADGCRHEQPTASALGAPDNPLGEDALRAKYEGLASLVLPHGQVSELRQACLDLEALSDVRPLVRLLAAPRGGARATRAD